MPSLTRFGVSIESDLIARFDRLLEQAGYPNRSEALRDLIRARLVDETVRDEHAYALGVLTMVYDHHKREIEKRLSDVQHDHHASIITTTHVHIDHDTCLEVILLKGRVGDLRSLASSLSTLKGIQHSKLVLTAVVPPPHTHVHE